MSVARLSEKCKARNSNTKAESTGHLTAQQSEIISDAVVRAGLCEDRHSSIIKIALRRVRLPSELVESALPSPAYWDPNSRIELRRHHLEHFNTRQRLWRVVLEESGLLVPLKWQTEPFLLLAGIALACAETRQTMPPAQKKTDAETFAARLQLLQSTGISSPQDFIDVVKKAGEDLYRELSGSQLCKESWYELEEGQLAKIITSRLSAVTASSLASECGVGHSLGRAALNLLSSGTEEESEISKELKSKWGLPCDATCNINAPPYQEIPHDFLYRASLASSRYISIDLKSADFHVLRLAVQDLIHQDNWISWVEETVPNHVKLIPFLGELKPLRVRVLGKLLHKKNAALQCHCLRLLVRLLLMLAETQKDAFAPVERVFQFSCDELCLKMRGETTLQEAEMVSNHIKALMEDLNWQKMLPVRIELFDLFRVQCDNLSDNGNKESDSGLVGADFVEKGHPALRESVQFVDLPAIHDPVWAKQSLPLLPAKERCDDSYFIRRVYAVENADKDCFEIQLKKLPKTFRPSVTLEHIENTFLGWAEKSPKELSFDAPEFVPKSPEVKNEVASKEESMLSSHAHEFVPSSLSRTVHEQGGTIVKTSFTANDHTQKHTSLSSDAPDFIPGVCSQLSCNAQNHSQRGILGSTTLLSGNGVPSPSHVSSKLSSSAQDFVPGNL